MNMVPSIPGDPIRLLSILCGLMFIPHSVAKFTARQAVDKVFESAGLRPVAFFVILSLIIEVIATIGLVFNVLQPYASWLGAMFMLSAGAASYKISGGKWNWSLGGCELHVFWALCMVIVAVHS
jgi:putative oxidoreductase